MEGKPSRRRSHGALRHTTVAAILLSACSNAPSTQVATNSEELREALLSAGPGDTVEVTAGELTGSFDVPAGVRLVGAGIDATWVTGPSDRPVLSVVASGTEPTVVQGLLVGSEGPAAIVAGGSGSVILEDLDVRMSRGIGIGVANVAALTLRRVSIAGPVTPENASNILEVVPEVVATHGLIAIGVGAVQATDVSIRGLASFGAALVESPTEWTGGTLENNMGTGIVGEGASLALTGLTVRGMIQGAQLIPSYGIFLNGAPSTSNDLQIADGDGYGLVHHMSSGTHTDLQVSGQGESGVFIQLSSGVALRGTGTRVRQSQRTGITVSDSSDVSIEDARVEDVTLGTVIGPGSTPLEVGDGIHLVASDTVTVRGVTLSGNERAGLLGDLDGGPSTQFTLDTVEVTATGEALGVAVQNGTVDSGWDNGVTRLGTADTNDSNFLLSGATLDIVGAVAPSDLPVTGNLATQGLGAVGVVAPSD